MQKLKLEMDDLRVESFTTAASADDRGTVEGHDATAYQDSCGCVRPSDGCTIGCATAADCTTQNNPGTVIEY